MKHLDYEKINYPGKIIIGVDEAGRGPWCGPVVAAAVILDYKNLPTGINDSKKLTIKKREILYPQIINTCLGYGVGVASAAEIDALNILNATMLAMWRAITPIQTKADIILVDGNKIPLSLNLPSYSLIGGDALSISIAAASIIAKIYRDNIMKELSLEHPEYLWHKNAGYGTREHMDALKLHGVTPHHRKSFRPIKELL